MKRKKPPAKDPNAVALGKKGGALGGRTRAARLTAEERSRAAKLASQARWGKKFGDTSSVSVSIAEGEPLDIRLLQQRVLEATQTLAQEQGTRLDDNTAMLKLVEAVGQLARAQALTGSKGNPPSRVKAMVEQELVVVLKAVLVLAGVMRLEIGELLRTQAEAVPSP